MSVALSILVSLPGPGRLELHTKFSVRDSMHRAGVKELPACVPRMLARAAKRSQVDYTGLDRRSPKNRRKAGQGKPSAACQNTIDPTGATAVLPDDASRVDTVGAIAATVEIARPDQATSPKSPVIEATAPLEGQGIGEALRETTQFPGSDPLDARSLISSVPEFFGSAAAFKAVETVLQHCIEVNFRLAKYKSGKTTVTTMMDDIQRYANDMADLEYDAALHAVRKSRALAASQDIQVRYNETFYWDIIVKKAKYIDPSTLKNHGGPSDEFTLVEKYASKIFMDQAGMGVSPENQRVRRRIWKRLSDMRRAGVDKLILYRTREFDNICEQNPKNGTIPLVERVLSWEKLFGPHIADLETLAMEEATEIPTGQLWLEKSHVAERLDMMPRTAWAGAKDAWHSLEEKAAFRSTSKPATVSGDQMVSMVDICSAAGMGRNKSIYATLVTRDESFLSVCSVITIHKGDFLGIFTGYFRYSEDFDDMYGVRGPTEKLWLDYSRTTGIMNQVQVAARGADANVALRWELINDDTGSPCV